MRLSEERKAKLKTEYDLLKAEYDAKVAPGPHYAMPSFRDWLNDMGYDSNGVTE